ncbi:uncharacterized protein LOC118463056 [Anopheles albimanus]|uniref:uncharacterized protein LOC118463056 n=1 Tax=Anopheles albimanus TaxID=7167 RepID=UPI001640C3C0|nr:uncharacterized protein LOC118463056 [Anopheles albimanus]
MQTTNGKYSEPKRLQTAFTLVFTLRGLKLFERKRERLSLRLVYPRLKRKARTCPGSKTFCPSSYNNTGEKIGPKVGTGTTKKGFNKDRTIAGKLQTMEKGAAEPVEPTKPPEIDPELTASAASAVEQWRNYQQAYAAYQHQYAAYQQYIQQTQYAQTAEQQQHAYSQYVEQHRAYQHQLHQYEQHIHARQNNGGAGGGTGGPAGAAGGGGFDPQLNWQQGPMPMVDASGSLMMQQPMGAGGPAPVAPNGYNHAPAERYPKRGNNFKRNREARPRYREHEKKSELHTKTVIYVNPDDESLLPEDLKKLFKDLQCDLCRTRMNSHVSANIHYQSKSHEKKINQWLKEYCIETGTPMPVRMRRQLELVAEATVVGRSVFHCEACDLPLTSIQHANQHYTGRRHYMVVHGKKLPSGNGFYNAEGKWIRSGNLPDKSIPVTTAQAVKRSAEQQAPGGAAGVGETVAKRERLEPPPELPKELAAQTAGVCWPAAESVPGVTGPAVPVTQIQMVAAPQQQQIQIVPQQQQQQPAVAILEPPPILTIKVDSDDDVQPVVSVATGQPLAPASMPTVATPVPGPILTVAPAGPMLNQASAMKPPATTLEQEIRKKEGLDCVDETGTFCLICETSVTSRSEMLMHIKGAKHIKKARTMGVMVRTTPFNPSDTILKSATKPPVRQTDWSLFRMPSGKFYCKTCNLIVADEKLFGQHWYGKKHKLKMRQEQAANQSKTPGSGTVSATGITVFDASAGTPVIKTENTTATGTAMTPAAATATAAAAGTTPGNTAVAPMDGVTPLAAIGTIPAIGDGARPPPVGNYGKRGWKRPLYFGRKPFYGKPRK